MSSRMFLLFARKSTTTRSRLPVTMSTTAGRYGSALRGGIEVQVDYDEGSDSGEYPPRGHAPGPVQDLRRRLVS